MPKHSVNGVQLYWELAGESGDPLVLVHGSWGDHHNWDAVVPDLSRSLRVVTYDRRGHSQSERPDRQGSVREDVADLAALIEHLRLGPAHIAGNSFGASIVLRLAGERPDLFRSLIAHEPPLFGILADRPEGRAVLTEIGSRAKTVIDVLEAGDNAEGARLFVESLAFGPGTWDKLPKRIQETFVFNAPTWLDETRDPESLTLDLGGLRSFRRPALISSGDQSPPFFPLVTAAVADALGQVQQRTFAGVGHAPHVTHPKEYVSSVLNFIKPLSGARPLS